jgi:MYXO-CTERM domain-containing protein
MKNFVAIVSVIASLAGAAQAQTVAQWDLLGQPGTQASVAGLGSANVTAGLLARGAGLSGNAGTNSINAAGWNDLGANDYYSLAFTVDAGYKTDLSSLYIGSRSSNSGPRDLGLYSSLDGFASPVHTWTEVGASAFANQIIDLSGLPDITGSVEFRIRATSNAAATGGTISSTGTFRLSAYFSGGAFDRNLQFTGVTTLVPTPGAAVLAGVAGLVSIRRRRTA